MMSPVVDLKLQSLKSGEQLELACTATNARGQISAYLNSSFGFLREMPEAYSISSHVHLDDIHSLGGCSREAHACLSLLTDINSTQKNQQVKYPGKDPTVQQGPLLLQEFVKLSLRDLHIWRINPN